MFLVSSSPQEGTDQTASTPEPYRTPPRHRSGGAAERPVHKHAEEARDPRTYALAVSQRDNAHALPHDVVHFRPVPQHLVAVIGQTQGLSKREVVEHALRTAYPREYRALVEREQAGERE